MDALSSIGGYPALAALRRYERNRTWRRQYGCIFRCADYHGEPVRLPDGTLGYHRRRQDDCFNAALATVLEVSIHEIPDPQIEEAFGRGESVESIRRGSWDTLLEWLDRRGLEGFVHRPADPNAGQWAPALDRWVGVLVPDQPDPAWVLPNDAVAMTRGDLLHDGYLWDCEAARHRFGFDPHRTTGSGWLSRHLQYGFSFKPKGAP